MSSDLSIDTERGRSRRKTLVECGLDGAFVQCTTFAAAQI